MHVHSCMQRWCGASPSAARGCPRNGPGAPLGGRGQRCALPMAGAAAAGLDGGAAGSWRVAKSGWLKLNMVIRSPMDGRFFGTYAPGVAFGRLSVLTAESGDSRQLASMNFSTD